MATYSAFLRDTGVDGTTIVVNPDKTISAYGMMQPVGPIFYVDGNINSSGNGKEGWRSAFKTLTEGLAAAQAWHGTSGNWLSWAGRATIFVKGDDLAEDIEDWARKTDVIGVGSDDGNKGPRILGHHVFDTWASGADDFTGLRLYNLTFKPSTTTVLVDIPTSQNGIEFHGCKWEWAASCTTGLKLTTCSDTVIDSCRFVKGSGTGFSTAAISIATGAINQTIIRNNYIDAGLGIVINAGTSGEGNLIQDNTIIAVTLTIDDDSNVFYIVDNRLISEAACGANGGTIGNCADINDKLACHNFLAGSDGNVMLPGTDMEW